VPEQEVEDYAARFPSVVGVPVHGITKTRNWILDNTKERYVVFIDDDVVTHGYIQLNDTDVSRLGLTEEEWLSVWFRLFEVCEDIGYPVWGVATDGAPRSVYPYRPFLWRSYVTASCMGIINDKLRFDEAFQVKEDYELCLRCMRDFGGVVAARFAYWQNEHWALDGGCKDYRTQEMEEDAIQRLIAMYPRYIRRVVRGGSSYSVELDF